MRERFVSLAFALGGVRERAKAVPLLAASPSKDATLSVVPAVETVAASASSGVGDVPIDDLLRELTLLRLAAIEAYARSSASLLESLARDVLGRELALAACDLDALVRATLARFADREPLSLRVPCGGSSRFSLDIPIVEDASLAPGDYVIDVRDGAIDARFALRLGDALASVA